MTSRQTSEDRYRGRPLLFSVLMLLLMYLANPSTVFSQWRGDGTQRYEAGVPYVPLSTLPELHTDMPLDCMVAYIAMDSIARTISDYEMIREFPARTSLDTLRLLARYYYALYDYDPLLIKRYINHTYDKINDSVHNYMTFPVNGHTGVRSAVRGRAAFSDSHRMLLFPGFVVRARVIEVKDGIDSTYNDNKTAWVNVACQVLDTIKGMHLPSNCALTGSNSGKNSPRIESASLPIQSCLIYGHPRWWTGKSIESNPFELSTMDRTIVRPEVDDVVYLFLTMLFSTDQIIIVPDNSYEPTGGIFVVKDGKVQDKGDFWGLGTEPTEADFRANLEQKISEIKSWWID